MFVPAGVVASSKIPYDYDFFGNEPVAWWDATLPDSLDVDGSYKVSNWRSRWTGKVPTEDWTLSQSTASDQPYYYSAGSGHDGDTNAFHAHNRKTDGAGGSAGEHCFTDGIVEFKRSGTKTGMYCGSDSDRNIDSPIALVAMYQTTYGTTGGLCGQADDTDWDTDRQWILYNINDALPKENRVIWAYAPTSSYKYTTNWTSGTYNQYNNPGTYFDIVSGVRLPSDTNKPSLFLKTDQTHTASTAYAKDPTVTGKFFVGNHLLETNPVDGYIAEVILFDADTTKFSNAQVESLILQMCKRHNIDSTSGTTGLGY